MQCQSFAHDNKTITFSICVLITGAKLWSLKTMFLSHEELQPGIIG